MKQSTFIIHFAKRGVPEIQNAFSASEAVIKAVAGRIKCGWDHTIEKVELEKENGEREIVSGKVEITF